MFELSLFNVSVKKFFFYTLNSVLRKIVYFFCKILYWILFRVSFNHDFIQNIKTHKFVSCKRQHIHRTSYCHGNAQRASNWMVHNNTTKWFTTQTEWFKTTEIVPNLLFCFSKKRLLFYALYFVLHKITCYFIFLSNLIFWL